MLQQHHIGGVLAQRPGLFFADDLHTGQWRPQAHVVLNLPGLRRALGTRTVTHQIAAEETRQLVFQQAPLLLQQQLPEWPGKPVARLADELEPLRIGLSEYLIGHRCLRMTVSASSV